MKIQRCKGMRDLSPDEMAAFRAVEGICRDCMQKWGYREVRTPTIEYLHLFTAAGTLTPSMLGKVYSFLDWDGWSGERVVLRPDGTIPVARYYTDKMSGQGQARLFYAANMFTFETGDGTRERWQCGAELIGAGTALADAELIVLSREIISQMGLKDVELRLSHAGLIQALLARLELAPEEQHRMFDGILDGDASLLAKAGKISPELKDMLLPLLSAKGQPPRFLRNQREALCRVLPEIGAPLDNFVKTLNTLDELDIKYQVNIASGAGFEYYTGFIFQYFTGGEKIGGGGRYDALIPSMGGGDMPASGFAVYLDRLINRIKAAAIIPPSPKRILVKPSPGAKAKDIFSIAASLRQAGFTAELAANGAADYTLEVKSATALTLIDKTGRKTTVRSVAEAISLLEARGAA